MEDRNYFLGLSDTKVTVTGICCGLVIRQEKVKRMNDPEWQVYAWVEDIDTDCALLTLLAAAGADITGDHLETGMAVLSGNASTKPSV